MDTIINFLSNIVTWCLDIVSKIWEWFYGLIKDCIEALLSPLADSLPDLSGAWDKIDVISPYVAFVNRWIALDYAVTLLTAYFVFILVMISIKLIVKLFIPTVG